MTYYIPKRAIADLNTLFMAPERHLCSEIICFATGMSLSSFTGLSSNLIPRINIPVLVVFLEVAKISSSIALLIINHQQTICMLAFFNERRVGIRSLGSSIFKYSQTIMFKLLFIARSTSSLSRLAFPIIFDASSPKHFSILYRLLLHMYSLLRIIIIIRERSISIMQYSNIPLVSLYM